MGNRDGESGAENEADVAEGTLAQIEHGEGGDDDVDRIAHTLEIALPEERGHGGCGDGGVLPDEEGVVAALVAAAVIAVMLMVMVEEAGLPAHGTGGGIPLTGTANLPPPGLRPFGRKLVTALTAKVFLVAVGVFAVTIK